MISLLGILQTDTTSIPLQLGVGGIFALLVIDRVLQFISRKKNGVADLQEVARQVNDLWVWHNKEDDEGVKIWYMRKSLETAIVRLADNIEVQTELLRVLHEDHKDSYRSLGRIEAHIAKE